MFVEKAAVATFGLKMKIKINSKSFTARALEEFGPLYRAGFLLTWRCWGRRRGEIRCRWPWRWNETRWTRRAPFARRCTAKCPTPAAPPPLKPEQQSESVSKPSSLGSVECVRSLRFSLPSQSNSVQVDLIVAESSKAFISFWALIELGLQRNFQERDLFFKKCHGTQGIKILK